MSVPLDVVFDSDVDGSRLLRRCILKVLVEILVWERKSPPKIHVHSTQS